MGFWSRLFGGEPPEQRLERARSFLAEQEPEQALRVLQGLFVEPAERLRVVAREAIAARELVLDDAVDEQPPEHAHAVGDHPYRAPMPKAPNTKRRRRARSTGSITFRPSAADGSFAIDIGGGRVVLNQPQSDDDGRPRSTDGLEVARRLVAAVADLDLRAPAFTFVDAALLLARSGEPLPHFESRQRRRLGELTVAAAARDHERAISIAGSDPADPIGHYLVPLITKLAPVALASIHGDALAVIRAVLASERAAGARLLVELGRRDLSDELVAEATLAAIDARIDHAELAARWPRPAEVPDQAARHAWLAFEVRRTARHDIEAALVLERQLPEEHSSDFDASCAVAARLAAIDGARAVAIARARPPDVDHLGWLSGCVRGGALGAGELLDEWIAALGPKTYAPYTYFAGLVEACIELGDAPRLRHCLEVSGPTGWQVAHAARWRLAAAAAKHPELLPVLLDRYEPGVVAGRAIERGTIPLAVGRVVIRPVWLDLADPHPVETLSIVAALGDDGPAWQTTSLP